MSIESKPFKSESETNPEKRVQVFELDQAPGFFIPFSFNPNPPNFKQELLKLIDIHNDLLAENILVIWRSFGLNGYLTDIGKYYILNEVLNNHGINNTHFGLPIEKDSFVIKFSHPDHPLITIYNAGSPAIVAAYKSNGFENKNSYTFTKIGNAESSVHDHKETPLEEETEQDLLLTLEASTPPFDFSIFAKLGLSPLSSSLDEQQIDNAFVLKIDINDSTRTKINNGRWLETERENTTFMGEFLSGLGNYLPQVYLIDPIGESIVIICDRPSLIPPIHKSLRTALGSFPNITVKAVGRILSNVTIYSSNNKSVFYAPFVEENFWYPLEQNYKNRSNGRPGSFLIPRD